MSHPQRDGRSGQKLKTFSGWILQRVDEGFQDRLATQAADELQDALAETAAEMENICEDYDLASFLVILSALPLTFQRQNCSLQQWRTNAPRVL